MSSITIDELGLEQPFEILRIDFAPSAAISEHPVELGANPVDHIQVRSERMVVEAIATDTPLQGSGQGRVADAVRWLTLAMGRLLTVVIDNEGVFESYAIENGAHPLTVVQSRRFTLRLVQIRVVSAFSVLIPPTQTANVGAPDPQSAGQQATTTDQAPEDVRTSTAYELELSASDLLRAFGLDTGFGGG